jgi:gamma-glutamylcyclotransferase
MAFDYFAYASNLAPNVITRLCPRHSYLGVAHLADHRLAFTRRSRKTGTGVADIVQAAGEMVWGVLYRIDDNELAAIDRKEGHDWAYKRVMLPVRLEGGPERTAVTYTVCSKERTQVPPSRQYLDLVIEAVRERGLPGPYIEQIEAIRVADSYSRVLPPTLQYLNNGSPTPWRCSDLRTASS